MTSRYLELACSNKTTDDKYSYKRGISQLNFTIPEGNFVLDPHSVRLVGDVRFFKNDKATPDPVGAGDPIGISSKLGIYSLFQSLIWRSSKYQTTISHEKNWNRWLSSYMAVTGGLEDSIGHLGETALTMPSYQTSNDSVVGRSEISSFCVPLICGLLQSGQSLPLTSNTLGGIDLSVMLESDAMALQVFPADFKTNPNTADFVGAYYELSNVKLICSVITPPPDQLSRLLSQKQGSISYQSVHSYYDTANSNNIQLAMNFGLSKVKSLFMNMTSSNKLNNLGEDSFATLPPTNLDGTLAGVQKVTFLRGGTIFPKLFPRDTNFKETTKTILDDPIMFRDYVNAISKYDSNSHLLGGVSNANRGFLGKIGGSLNDGKNRGTPYQFVNNGGVFFGVGINYENYLGGSGIDLSKQAFGMAMECNLTSSNSQSIFLFVNAESTILWSDNGVQLIQ